MSLLISLLISKVINHSGSYQQKKRNDIILVYIIILMRQRLWSSCTGYRGSGEGSGNGTPAPTR